MTKKYFPSLLRLSLLIVLLTGMVFQPQSSAYAAPVLTIEPITWNVIGLDSNNVSVGPNTFPVGARVCNAVGADPATNLQATFNWGASTNAAYIYLRNGSYGTVSGGSYPIVSSLAAGACHDFYFEVEVLRDPNSRGKSRPYSIDFTYDGGSISTPSNREIYVEWLVSQNRNYTVSVELDGAGVAAGGTMTLLVGNTYNIKLIAKTATQGYEQIESFINFPNTIFSVNGVTTTYSAQDSVTPDTAAGSKLYADGCSWENDITSLNYRSCWETGKYGGNVEVVYNVTIIGGAGTTNPLNTLIYDFSGSSYHYNADFSTQVRFAYILDPSLLTFSKSFNPDPTSVNGTSRLTFTIGNPTAGTVNDVNFSDDLPDTGQGAPGNMVVATPAIGSTSGCGTPNTTGVTGGNISVTDITVAAGGTCTISLDVTVPATGTYNNTSTELKVGTIGTGKYAVDNLTVNNNPPTPPAVCGTTIAAWTFTGLTSANSASPTTSSGTGTASAGSGLNPTIFTSPPAAGNAVPSWGTNGSVEAGATLTLSQNNYLEFRVNATGYTAVRVSLDAKRANNGPNGIAVYYGTGTGNPETGTPLYSNDTALSSGNWVSFVSNTTSGFSDISSPPADFYVRVYFFNAAGTQLGRDGYVDNVTITGCGTPTPPTISKQFLTDPIAVNGTSTLQFTVTNTIAAAITGVQFTDTLPSGLELASATPTLTGCSNSTTPSFSPALSVGGTQINLTNASISASGVCTVEVSVRATTAGLHTNISGYVSSTTSGTNTTTTATDTLTALLPPLISKQFSPNPIFTGGTSTLTFTITNPNLSDPLTGVNFTDPLPGGVVVANPPTASATSCNYSSTPIFNPAATDTSLSFSTGSIAPGGTCTVKVNVTAAAAGNYPNTTAPVDADIVTGTDTASDTLIVEAPVSNMTFTKKVSLTNTYAGTWISFLPVPIGTTVYYKFEVENTGDVELTNVDISDLASYVNLSSCAWKNGDAGVLDSNNNGSTADPGDGDAPFRLPVDDGSDYEHVAYCIIPVVAGTTDTAGNYPNSATATDPAVSDKTSSARFATSSLLLDKTTSSTGFVTDGEIISYSYQVTNNGVAPLQGPVTVSDDKATVSCPAVSTAETAPSTPGNGDNYLDFGEYVTCTATYTTMPGDVAAKFVTNTATAYAGVGAGKVTSNTDTETVYGPVPNLTLGKTNNASSLTAGGTTTYELTVSNTGNTASSGTITVVDVLPSGLSYSGASPFTPGGTNGANWSCSVSGQTITCTSSTAIAATSGTSVFSFTVDVASSASGTLTNKAQVGGGGDPTNPNAPTDPSACTGSGTPNEGCAVDSDPILSANFADLSLTKNVSNTTPLIGSTIKFTLTVTNALTSTVTATNVVVTDVIPSGFTYVPASANPSQGSYTSGTGAWTVGSLGNGASATLELDVTVNVSGNYTNYTQITGVTEVDPDSTPNNGTPPTPNEDDEDSVTVNPTQNDPSGLSKSVSGSNQAFTTNPNVAIGEIVEYTVNVTIPPGVFVNSQLVDTMERGLSFMTCSSITESDAGLTTNVAGSFNGACTTPTVDDAGGGTTVDAGRRVTFDLGTLTNASGSDQTLTFVYSAVVLDSAANVSGVVLSNSAVWTSDSGTLPPASASVLIAEADLSITKTADTSLVAVGSEITITLAIQHTGNSETNAYDTVVTDTLPTKLQYVPGSISCTSGAQDPDVACGESGGTITAEWSNFALGGGNGRITFRVTIVSLPGSGISNVANVAWSSLPSDVSTPQNSNVFSTERDYDPASNIDVYGASDTLVIGVFGNALPATGFAPNVVTDLGNTPSVSYSQVSGVTVEVPSLGINLPIVGVPLKDGSWDVSWLGNQAGWLDGSAFPSWSGNSVLTSHVYGANGLPGPFVNLNRLKYGDKIVVHAYGQKFTYEVRTNTVVEPNDASVFKHEEKAWITLVTCKEYDEKTNTYGKRVVVRAVLVSVGWE